MVGVLLNLTGLPFLLVASVSLYSKLTREETQGNTRLIRMDYAELYVRNMWLQRLWLPFGCRVFSGAAAHVRRNGQPDGTTVGGGADPPAIHYDGSYGGCHGCGLCMYISMDANIFSQLSL